MKKRKNLLKLAAALAEMTVGTSVEAGLSAEPPSDATAPPLVQTAELPLYRVLDGREFEMFRLLGKGHGLQHIAFHFSLSSEQTERSLEAIQSRLGCRSRADLSRLAGAWMREHGLR